MRESDDIEGNGDSNSQIMISHLEKVIRQTTDAIFTTDGNYIIKTWNKGAERLYGYSAEEALGKKIGELVKSLIPENILEQTMRQLHKNGRYQGEYCFAHKNGHSVHVHASVTVFREADGSISGYGAIHRDISEIKKVEEELKAFNTQLKEEVRQNINLLNNTFEESSLLNQKLLLHLTNSPFAVIEWDADHTIISWPQQAQEIFGWTEHETVGKKFGEINLVYQEDIADVEGIIDRLLKGKVSSLRAVGRNVTKAGEVIYCEWHNSVLKDVNGKVVSGMSFVQDITEQKKTELALIKNENDLRNLSAHLQNIREEERTNIAREIHDELGERLTSIRLNISRLENQLSTADKLMSQNFSCLLSIVDDTIRTIRKISTELRPSILDDFGLVDALEWHAEEFEKRTAISCTFTASVSSQVFDKKISITLFRIFQEALTNVSRHSDAKNVLAQLTEIDEHLELVITDDGIGMDTNKVKDRHTLGLLGMKERALMANGRCTVVSSKGAGTTIMVSVPYNKNGRRNDTDTHNR